MNATSDDALITHWPAHTESEIAAVAAVLRSGRTNYWSGGENTAFQTEWARFVGLPRAFTVANGTVALEASLRALTPGAGADGGAGRLEVIVPARTFMACASAVVHAGMKPVLADIDAGTLCVNAATVEAAATPRTVGVMVVHFAGLPCPDMDEIVRLCMRRGWWVIEDCSHAHGAGGPGGVGRRSHAAVWSMCYGKVMSSGGEGGVIACLDNGVADRIMAYRDHGRYAMTGRVAHGGPVGLRYEYLCDDWGSNLRMTEIQAVLARSALRRLPGEVARRRVIAAAYDEALTAAGVAPLHSADERAAHARYLYLARVGAEHRDRIMQGLVAMGIPARVGGTPSLAHEPVFRRHGWVYDTPVADAVGAEVFSLPVYPTMSDADVTRVCDAVREVL